ncbi:MAG: exosome complex protein Rrp42 [Methanobrevibacter sp.]|jgi:exosome complex component RRP42|nr:exosome complex protein Rrp42 [Methanobrevibacter sp.]
MNIIPEITRESITHIINENKRVDGRALDEYRNIEVENNVISKAEGSARVKIGKTQVIVGIKPTIGEPFGDKPNLGVLMTNAEMLPMADPKFEAGPPSEASVELARVVDRAIRESEIVDLERLCIKEGKKVWMLFIDLHIIDFDGNLFDAATLAVVSALSTTKLPKATFENDEVVLNEEETENLVLREKVVMSTFVKIGDKMVLDPALDEESILKARISIGITESGKICAMQKGGDEPLSRENILEAVDIAYFKNKELISKLNGY